MPPIYNPYDHYWRKQDGSAYHSRRECEVPADDPEYQAWLADGNVPKEHPRNHYGEEDREWMLAILQPWGLKIYPLTETEEYEENQSLQGQVGGFVREPAGNMELGEKGIHDREAVERIKAHLHERHRYKALVRLGAMVVR